MTKPISVLLVEDNPGDAELTRDTLESGKLHLDISVAIDGPAALRHLLGEAPDTPPHVTDLIVLDLNLPKLDGRAVLAEIRKHDTLRAIPVVVLTTSDAELDIEQCYALGANCYISKPVDLTAFQSIVRSIEGFWLTVVKLP